MVVALYAPGRRCHATQVFFALTAGSGAREHGSGLGTSARREELGSQAGEGWGGDGAAAVPVPCDAESDFREN
jgi:hypothetical protein